MLFIPQPTSTLREILVFYTETVSPTKKSCQTEIYRIKAICNLLGDMQFSEITPAYVVAYRDKRLKTIHPRDRTKTLATSTVKLELMLLSHVFSTAIAEWGMEHLTNPVLKIRKPKAPPGRSRRMSSEEEKNVLGTAYKHQNHEFYAIVILALETAMRQGEIIGLLWENISWSKRTALLPLTKNGDIREVPLSRKAFEILQDYLVPKKDGRVFSYTSSGIKSSWKAFIKNLGITNLHFHDLRHCAISSLIERGLSSIEVAAISGHKSMSMLKRYSHLHAYKLVGKLDPKLRSKKLRPILRDNFPAYPVIFTHYSRKTIIEFPDFIGLQAIVYQKKDAIEKAKTTLLSHLVTLLCDGVIPSPPSSSDSIFISSPKSLVEFISPIGKLALAHRSIDIE
jgi:integrase